MTPDTPRIAYLTAGAGGMFCGSCLRDNALVVALARQGVDATLIPTYTPIRTDESNVSVDRVFFGGINVYLQQRLALFRHLPLRLDRWLDQPWLIRLLARDVATPKPRMLDELTLSMLRGSHGYQHKEIRRLSDWLEHSLRPDLINFGNILIAGSAAHLKSRLGVPIVVTLQGDDIFLDTLSDDCRRRAITLIRESAEHVDAFIVFNRWYADYMQQYLGLPANKFRIVPLGINLDDYRDLPLPKKTRSRGASPPTVGYLARLAPEKGLHILVDAFVQLHQSRPTNPPRLLIAGWLGKHDRGYADEQFNRLRSAGLEDAFEYLGVVDRHQKLEFLSQIDVLSVPTVYQDPKGLYVLEALAAGVPVVQPDHGAFTELLHSTGGGRLVPPNDAPRLAGELRQLLANPEECRRLGQFGQERVKQRHTADAMARETMAVYQGLLQLG